MSTNWTGQPQDPHTQPPAHAPQAAQPQQAPAPAYGPAQQVPPAAYGPAQQVPPAAYGHPVAPYATATYASSSPRRMIDGSMEKNGFNGWALALSIIGLCCMPTAVAGAIMGYLGRQYAQEGRATNEGVATAAMVIGIISFALWVVGMIFRFFIFGAILTDSDLYVDSGY